MPFDLDWNLSHSSSYSFGNYNLPVVGINPKLMQVLGVLLGHIKMYMHVIGHSSSGLYRTNVSK